ncbi:MAG: OadG family protein [Clostridia bacterium]|nr:OadG family protein [Clostridia bacterium]
MEFLDSLLNFGDEVSNSAPLSDRLMFGLQTALLGMGVIFAVLIILWAVLSVFKLVFYKGDSEETSKATEVAPAPIPQSVPVQSAPNDAELVAVITAAIAATLDKPQTSFRVVSFRRTASK